MISAILEKGLSFGSRWGQKLRYVVIHWTASSTFDSAFRELRKNGTSYHYIVDGATVWQLVDEKNAAYHAGNYLTNLQAVGVSHIGMPGFDVKEETYATSGQLIAEILKRNNLEPNRNVIRLHREIKPTACPGTLDIERLINEVRKFYYGEVPAVPVTPNPVENPAIPPMYTGSFFPKKVQVTANVRLRIRAEANTTSEIKGFKEVGEIFEVVGETEGETITSNKWYNTGYGYISADFVKDVQ